jgi:hypothetical protein
MSKIAKINDTITKTICIPKLTTGTVTGVQYEIEVPDGITISDGVPTKGTFDKSSGIWTIGTYANTDTTPCLVVTFLVSEECPDGSEATIKLINADCDSNTLNNEICIPLDYITCCDIRECLPSYSIVSPQGSIDITAVIDANGDTTWNIDTLVGTYDTNTRLDFVEVLPNGDLRFNIIDVVGTTILSTFDIPIGAKIKTVSSPDNSVDVNLNGSDYELSVTHTENNDQRWTLNDSTVVTNVVTTILERNENYTGTEVPLTSGLVTGDTYIISFNNGRVYYRWGGASWIPEFTDLKTCGTTTRFRTVTADDSFVVTDGMIFVNNTGGPINITVDPTIMLTMAGCSVVFDMKVVGVEPTNANTVTLTATSGVIFDDIAVGNVYTFATLGENITFISDGSNIYLK